MQSSPGLTSVGVPFVEIRQSRNHLTSAMGFIILVKQHLYTLPNKVGGGILESHCLYLIKAQLTINLWILLPPHGLEIPFHITGSPMENVGPVWISSSGYKDSYLKTRCSRNRIVFIIGNPMLVIHLYIEMTLCLSDASFLCSLLFQYIPTVCHGVAV